MDPPAATTVPVPPSDVSTRSVRSTPSTKTAGSSGPYNQPTVTIGVLTISPDDNQILFGHAPDGSLALPTGALKMMEDWEGAAARIVYEQLHVAIDESDVQFVHLANDPRPFHKQHAVTLFFLARAMPQSVTRSDRFGRRTGDNKTAPPKFSWGELRALQHSRQLFGPLSQLVAENPATVHKFFGTDRKWRVCRRALMLLVVLVLAGAVAFLMYHHRHACDGVATGPIVSSTEASPVASPVVDMVPDKDNLPESDDDMDKEPVDTDSATVDVTVPDIPALAEPSGLTRHVCSPGILALNPSNCARQCAVADCCQIPTNLPGSCWSDDNVETCQSYSQLCSRDTSDSDSETDLPAADIDALNKYCSASLLLNPDPVVYKACADAACPAAVSCCFDGSCASAPECVDYAPCGALFNVGYDNAEVVTTYLEKVCVPGSDDKSMCEQACTLPGTCCLQQEKCPWLTNFDFCNQYAPCQVLIS